MKTEPGLKNHLQDVVGLLQASMADPLINVVENAVDAIVQAFKNNRALLTCGNGGSAADSNHIAAELVGRFYKMERQPLRCINLASDPATLTSLSNDYGFEDIFARQVLAYGEQGSVLWGISTSGNSPNVIKALERAKSLGMITIGMTGQGGGKMAALSDHLIAVPSSTTFEIQQIHICIYHYMCGRIETLLN